MIKRESAVGKTGELQLDGGIITGGVQVDVSKESAARFDEGEYISVKGRIGLYTRQGQVGLNEQLPSI